MIKENIIICIENSYDLVEWEKAVIVRCIMDNPSFTNVELSKTLNINPRTFFRKMDEFKLDIVRLKKEFQKTL